MFEDPAFWVFVAFVLFIAAAGRKILKLVVAGLDKRTAAIRSELDEAQRLRSEAQVLLVDYQRKTQDATREAAAIIAHARDEAARIGAEAQGDLEVTLARRREQAVEKIARAEASAVQEVRNAATDLALRVTRRLIAERLDPQRDTELVAAAIAEVGTKLH
ncbi:MAG: F0F1 ATP synthase subunit B [Alphaproteobacteria bacterium]|nr:F0F1 ATP synthase subunit B [Alphaproteobacteria bacterium]